MSLSIQKIAPGQGSLLPEYRAKLGAMRENITARDRRDAAETLGMTYTTVSSYITGRGTNLQTYEVLVSFFINRISLRKKSLGV
jgi:predicted transcriptional regulator